MGGSMGFYIKMANGDCKLFITDQHHLLKDVLTMFTEEQVRLSHF